MPLVTAARFPGLFAQPSNRGLTEGINQAFGHVSDTMRLNKIMEAKKADDMMQGRAAQFEWAASLPLDEMRSQVVKMANNTTLRDEDVSVFTEILNTDRPDQLRLNLLRAAHRLSGARQKEQPTKFQNSGTRFARDEGDNLFALSASFDPTNADIEGQVTPINHSNKPNGKLTIVGGTGETPEQKREGDIDVKTQTEEIKTEQEKIRLEQQYGIKGDEEPGLQADINEAKNSVARSEKAYAAVDNLRNNAANLRQALSELRQGAGTGAIEQWWPSFRAASVALDSTRGRLGLDIVQSTTFGALSKGELDLSKEIALPVGLDEPELDKWITGRIDAQNKKANYLERQAIFLGSKNAEGKRNTTTDWFKAENAAMDAAMESIGATEEDIKATMQKHNMDRSSVLAEIRRRYESGS